MSLREKYALEHRTIAPGVELHLHSSEKRKTNQLKIAWLGALSESDVTARALLPSVLLRGSESAPDMNAVARRLEELYGAAFSGDVSKVGERHLIVFRASFPNDHYLPAGESILEPMLEFVQEGIERPHLVDGVFPHDVMEQEKLNHRRAIESLINDKRAYARERCLQEMCRNEIVRLYEYGRVEDLDAITGESLTELWRQNLADSPVHIYFSGHYEGDGIADSLARFGANRTGEPRELPPIEGGREAGPLREVEEELDVVQAKLTLGFRSPIRYGHPRSAAVSVANGILGGFVHSKLFVNVREGASLCYTVGSSVDRAHGLMMISSRIEAEKRDEAQALILKQVEAMQAGEITDDELDATHRAYENRLRMLEDNPAGLINLDLTWRLNGQEYDHEEYLRSLLAVTKDDVVEASREWALDTIYFLRPRREK